MGIADEPELGAVAGTGQPPGVVADSWIALHIGRPVGRALLYPITLYFLATATAARRGSRLFLRRALGREPGWRELFRHIHCFAATILDRVYFLTGRLDQFEIEIFGGQRILDQAASGRGCILLGSHLGSFEALRATRRQPAPPSHQNPDEHQP